METLKIVVLPLLYLYALIRAIPLYRSPIATPAWRAAWAVVILLSFIICTRWVLLFIDTWILGGILRHILLHQVFRDGLPLLAAIMTALLCHVQYAITIRKTPFLYPETAVVVMNAHGRVLSWNAECVELFGWEFEEVAGQELAQFIIPERLQEQHRAGLAKALQGGETPVLREPLRTDGRHKDGTEFPVEVIVTQHRFGQSITYVGIIRRRPS